MKEQQETKEITLEDLELTKSAFICNDFLTGQEYYTAYAQDANRNDYKVRWEIINPDCEDEGNACDWKNPSQISLL